MAAALAAPLSSITIGQSLMATVAGGLFGKMLAGDSESSPAPAPPAPSEPTVMPTADDAAVKNAKRKSIAAQVARRGRASTILSDSGSETLGG